MNFSKLNDFIRSLPACGIPGCEIAVTYKGEQVFRTRTGYSDKEFTKPVSPSDIYRMYSVSKVTTCVAAMQLVERGVIALDDPVSKYLPAYAYLTVKDKNGKVVPAKNTMTVFHLFTMTGGLNYETNTAPIIREFQNPSANTVSLCNAIAKSPLDFEPGTDFKYSLCHDVLAAVVEVASDMRFADYTRTQIFEPLGMHNTCFHLSEEQKSRLAALYSFRDKALELTYMEEDRTNILKGCPNFDSGGGGLYSTVDDQIRFLTVLANGGKTEDGYSLLHPETIELLRVNRLQKSALPNFAKGFLFGYGWGLCGCVHMDPVVSRARSAVGEFGWHGAAGSYAMVDPTNRVAIFYAMQVKNCKYAHCVIHPNIRDLTYECLGV